MKVKLRELPINIAKKRFRRRLKSKKKKRKKTFQKLINKYMDYSKRIELLLKKNIIKTKNEVFIPKLKNSIELSNFYQEYLEHKSFNFIKPIFFFGAEETLNAWAWKCNGLDIICINHYAILFINNLFNENQEFINNFLRKNEMNTRYDNKLPAITIMKQMIEMFLFYHELGHLIQEQPPSLTSTFIEEIHKEKEDFDLLDHVSEFDSDIFAAVKLASHIFLIYGRQKGLDNDNKRKQFLEDICILAITSYITYRLKLFPEYGSFYTEGGSHPHIIFRIFILSVHFTKAIIDNSKIELDRGRILTQSIQFVEDFSKVLLNNNDVNSFIEMGKDNKTALAEYTYKVNEIVIAHEGSAFVKSQKNKKNA